LIEHKSETHPTTCGSLDASAGQSPAGLYFGPGHGSGRARDFILLHCHDGNWWLIANDYLVSMQAATRVVRRAETIDLRRLNESELTAEIRFRRDVTLLRNPTGQRWRDLITSSERDDVVAAGGPERFAAADLAGMLDDAESAVADGERAWFTQSRQLLASSTSARPAIWPTDQDARVLDLVTRQYRSRDTVQIADGWQMTVTTPDDRRRGCVAGLIFPEPSCNNSHPPTPSEKIDRENKLCYFFLQMSPARTGDERTRDCAFRPVVGHAYKRYNSFPFYLFADAEVHTAAVQFVGYMSAEIYMAPEITGEDLLAILSAHSAEVRRQAE
jgi:hypothetical protein